MILGPAGAKHQRGSKKASAFRRPMEFQCSANAVIALSVATATFNNSAFLCTEHVLWALCKAPPPQCGAVRWLAAVGVAPDAVVAALESLPTVTVTPDVLVRHSSARAALSGGGDGTVTRLTGRPAWSPGLTRAMVRAPTRVRPTLPDPLRAPLHSLHYFVAKDKPPRYIAAPRRAVCVFCG